MAHVSRQLRGRGRGTERSRSQGGQVLPLRDRGCIHSGPHTSSAAPIKLSSTAANRAITLATPELAIATPASTIANPQGIHDRGAWPNGIMTPRRRARAHIGRSTSGANRMAIPTPVTATPTNATSTGVITASRQGAEQVIPSLVLPERDNRVAEELDTLLSRTGMDIRMLDDVSDQATSSR